VSASFRDKSEGGHRDMRELEDLARPTLDAVNGLTEAFGLALRGPGALLGRFDYDGEPHYVRPGRLDLNNIETPSFSSRGIVSVKAEIGACHPRLMVATVYDIYRRHPQGRTFHITYDIVSFTVFRADLEDVGNIEANVLWRHEQALVVMRSKADAAFGGAAEAPELKK
jgi:hypothetical protein